MAGPVKLDLSMFLADYLNDARDGFQVANRALLALEKDPRQTERLGEIFRAVHTLKSSSAMLNFAEIAELSHFSEDLLDRLRDREIPVNHEAIDLLLEIVDTLQKEVEERARSKGQGGPLPDAPGRLQALKDKAGHLGEQEQLARQGVIVINEQGLIESFNLAAERMFGYTVSEMIGQNVACLIPESQRGQHDAYLHDYLLTGRSKIIGSAREVTGVRKGGATFAVELVVNEMRLGDRRLFVGIAREVYGRPARTAETPTLEKSQTVRVQVGLLDTLFNLVGELIITRNRIDTLLAGIAKKELKTALASMERIVNELQEGVSSARLVPVDEIFQKFPRMVRDLAREQGKEIDLILKGRDIELDKGVLDAISEPLLHLLRNAVDHGVEASAERTRRNKPRQSTIQLSAIRAESHVLIAVEDDGGGVDLHRVRAAGVRKGFLTAAEAETLPEKDVLNLLFRPGFSSAERVSDLSGRGVGLDIVKVATERLGGVVEVTTAPGHGTRFTLRLPLATAILQTLVVGIGDQVFAIPTDLVLETLDVKMQSIRGIGKNQVLLLRQEAIPFVPLQELLNLPTRTAGNGQDVIAVIIHRGDKLVGVGVDTVLDQIESIIKPFDRIAQGFRGFSGGTILGDGRVALLLDLPTLLGFDTLQL